MKDEISLLRAKHEGVRNWNNKTVPWVSLLCAGYLITHNPLFLLVISTYFIFIGIVNYNKRKMLQKLYALHEKTVMEKIRIKISFEFHVDVTDARIIAGACLKNKDLEQVVLVKFPEKTLVIKNILYPYKVYGIAGMEYWILRMNPQASDGEWFDNNRVIWKTVQGGFDDFLSNFDKLPDLNIFITESVLEDTLKQKGIIQHNRAQRIRSLKKTKLHVFENENESLVLEEEAYKQMEGSKKK